MHTRATVIEFFIAELTLKKVRSLLHPICHKWKHIAVELEISNGTIESLKQQYNDPKDLLSEVVSKWLKGISPQPSWEILASALDSKFVNAKDIAKKIRDQFCDQSKSIDYEKQMPQPHSSAEKAKQISKSPTEVYVDYMKSLYRRSEFPDDNKWPLTPSKRFIDLVYVNKKSEAKQGKGPFTDGIDQSAKRQKTIDMKDIGRPQSDSDYPHIILVEGAPGVGKTTFAWQLCRKWANKKLLKMYDLVILLRLQDRKVREAKMLNDLFYHSDSSLSEKVRKEVESVHGKGTMFIFEGFDEFTPELRKLEQTNSIFTLLLSGQVLPSSTIMVTSRPWALTNLKCKFSSSITQHVEILGFTNNRIFEYIKSFDERNESFLKFVEVHPLLCAVMYIPLNAAIVYQVYQDMASHEGVRSIFPTTLTELYSDYTLTLLLRYLKSTEKYKNIPGIISHHSLPSEIKKVFDQLCELAYVGLEKQQLTFTGLSDDFETLGFMRSCSDIHVSRGVSLSYNFLHFTLQEYLAAVYIAEHKDPADYLEKITFGYNDMYIRFLAGITQLKNPLHSKYIFGETNLMISVPYYTCLNAEAYIRNIPIYCDMSIKRGCLNWWYESRNENVITNIPSSTYMAVFMPQTPLDYYVLGHCIAISHCKWKLIFDKDCIIDHNCSMLMIEGLKTAQGKSVIDSIYLNTYLGTKEAFGNLMKSLANQNKLTGLHDLEIHQQSLLSHDSYNVFKVCPLEIICVSCKYGRVGDFLKSTSISRTLNYLEFHPLSSRELLCCKNVPNLVIRGPCDFDGDLINAICEVLSKSKVIRSLELVVPGTHHLEMNLCRFHRYNIEPLFDAIKYNKTVTHLSLKFVTVNTSLKQLNSLLLRNKTLEILYLYWCGINNEILSSICRIFRTGKVSLKTLILVESVIDCNSVLPLLDKKSLLEWLAIVSSEKQLQNFELLISALVPGIRLRALLIGYITQQQFDQMRQHYYYSHLTQLEITVLVQEGDEIKFLTIP